MKYIVYKNWHNGGKQFIEETNDGSYADKRVKELILTTKINLLVIHLKQYKL